MKKKILVLGATGKTGKRVIERLEAKGIQPRYGSRSATPAFDWEDDSTWSHAVKGMTAVYITFQPDLAVPGADETIRKFVKICVMQNVTRLVLLSGRGEPEARDCEEVVKGSGVEWTIVRASWFNQNFSENYFLESILAGQLVLPAGDVGEPFVDADDIADVVVASLTEPGHTKKVYEVTGPRLLTFADAVKEIALACGRPLTFQAVPLKDYNDALSAQSQTDWPCSISRPIRE